MVDRDKLLKKINEMPIDELQVLICKALDDSGIAYSKDGDGIPLFDFLKINPMTELKSCPFCGYPARLWVDDGSVCVCCVNKECAIQTPRQSDKYGHDPQDWVDTRNKTAVDRVIEKWNRRASNERIR